MKSLIITEIIQSMLKSLDNAQIIQLKETLEAAFSKVDLIEKTSIIDKGNNSKYLSEFLSAKRIEGCSEKTLNYYSKTIQAVLDKVSKDVKHISTEDLRGYLTDYQTSKQASKVTMDNIRRILSSFFSWLEDEDFIIKNPVRRIHKVRTSKVIKETYTDEELELMRDSCDNMRDLAMIDMLASTGMRVGEMTRLNRTDIDFNERECIVLGKGDKERVVYFDARSKLHLQSYLDSRSTE